MPMKIRKVGVLGAGVMGSGIAAHVAGAGYPVLLLDIVPPMEPPPGTDRKSKAWRNKFALDAKEKMLKARPNAYHVKSDQWLIETGNLEDDLARLNECDWVIEAVKEDLEVKRDLFGRIDNLRKKGLVLTSNTSGLPIARLVEGMSDDFKRTFFVTHFFNPPRYMRLLEIVAGPDTDAGILANVVKFGEDVLGKGVVYGRDTPNFVANRIGTFGMLDTMHAMLEEKFSPEEVDAMFGTPVGHPKSALFRTGDLVGLDTFGHVAKNCYDLLADDEARETFRLPEYVVKMVKDGKLGDKSKGGFYKKTADGLATYDPYTAEYRPQAKAKLAVVKAVRDLETLPERLRAIGEMTDDRHAQFMWKITARTLGYSARRLGDIADDVTQIDRAMKWGFNWELGPFETWDAMGFAATAARMKKAAIALPKWVDEMVASEVAGFYRNDGTEFYDPLKKQWKKTQRSERSLRLPKRDDPKRVVAHNDSATLFDLGDGVFCVEFHSKMNSVDGDIVAMLNRGLDEAEKSGGGLVVGNEATDAFSAGANLGLILGAAHSEEWAGIEQVVREFQAVNQRMKFADVPVVAAPFGLTLGGGAEITLGAQAVRAHVELYMGLVEVGVGLIPGGGGTKEVLWRFTQGLPDSADLFPHVQRAFEQIGMAKVSMGAMEAKEMGLLTPCDRVSFHREQLLFDAKQTVLAMNLQGFRPQKPRLFRVGGTPAYANLAAGLHGMKEGHMLSEHDYKIGLKLAFVLTGGNVMANTRVTEERLTDLEREAFMSLVGEEKTKERMMYMLQNGKPLRN